MQLEYSVKHGIHSAERFAFVRPRAAEREDSTPRRRLWPSPPSQCPYGGQAAKCGLPHGLRLQVHQLVPSDLLGLGQLRPREQRSNSAVSFPGETKFVTSRRFTPRNLPEKTWTVGSPNRSMPTQLFARKFSTPTQTSYCDEIFFAVFHPNSYDCIGFHAGLDAVSTGLHTGPGNFISI